MRPLKRVEREFTFKITTVHTMDNVTRTTVNKMYLPMRGTLLKNLHKLIL